MSSTLLTVDEVTAEALRVAHNNMALIANIDKQHDGETTIAGRKRGASLRIRKPIDVTVREDWNLDTQDIEEEYVTLTYGVVRGVDLYVTDAELSTDIDNFSRLYLQPAMSRLTAKIEHYCFEKAVEQTYNLVGTAGTAPGTVSAWMAGQRKLHESLAPAVNRKAVINPAAEAASIDGLKALFHSGPELSKQYVNGAMGRALGLDYYMSQNVKNLTVGTRSGTILVNGTVSTEGSTTIAVDGLGGATQTFVAGDHFTVAGVYAVNRETKESTGQLQDFVVTTAATASGSAVSLTVAPAMYTTGAKQNIDAFPQDNAAVTVTGTASTAYPQNLLFYPEAYTFATAKLEMPEGVDYKGQQEIDGISLRVVRQWDIRDSSYPLRIDCFFAFLAQRPEWACRVVG